MERQSPKSIGDILRNLFQDNCMQSRFDEIKAMEVWRKVVGPSISSDCSQPKVKEGKMTIGVPKAALRHELNMNRTRLKDMINNIMGKDVIKEIRFIS